VEADHQDNLGSEAHITQPDASTSHLYMADILDNPVDSAGPDVNDLLAQQPKTEPVPAPEDATASDHPASADPGHSAAPDTASLDAQLVDTDDPDLI